MPEPAAELARHLTDAGIDPAAAVWAAPPAPDAPRPPEGPWVLVPYGQQVVVGGVGRGTFVAYESLWRAQDAIDLAVRLAADPLPVAHEPTAEERASGAITAAGIRERTRARGGSPGPAGLRTGERLDVFGAETGHHAFALGTPFPERSQPPSDVGNAYRTFEVVAALPDTVREGMAGPWFEQPGGGAMVVFDRPLRWYVDQGFLAPSASG